MLLQPGLLVVDQAVVLAVLVAVVAVVAASNRHEFQKPAESSRLFSFSTFRAMLSKCQALRR